jgi:hypothetical protein
VHPLIKQRFGHSGWLKSLENWITVAQSIAEGDKFQFTIA